MSKGFFCFHYIWQSKSWSVNRKSQVSTAGKLVSSFSMPSSISLEMNSLLPSIFKSEIKQA